VGVEGATGGLYALRNRTLTRFQGTKDRCSGVSRWSGRVGEG
jgi:hypothetical protein